MYFCDPEEPEAEITDTTNASELLEADSEDPNAMKEKMQVDPSEEDEDDLDANGDNGNGDIQNQDDDQEGEPTAQPTVPTAQSPNSEQPRVYSMPDTSGRDNRPQPEYNPGYSLTPRGKCSLLLLKRFSFTRFRT